MRAGRVSVVVVGALAGCGDSSLEIADAAPPACSDPGPSAMFIDGAALGPMYGTTATVAMQPGEAGDLIVVSVAMTPGNAFPKVTVPSATAALQVGVYPAGCDRGAIMWSFGNVGSAVGSVNVTVSPATTFAVFALRFRGLPADVGAAGWHPYSHTTNAIAPQMPACPGSAIVSTMVSCDDAATFTTTSPFHPLDMVGGASSAGYVAPALGAYGGEWQASASSAATTVVFY